MPKLVPLKPEAVVRKLRRLGFDGPYPGGRHRRMVNPITGKIIPIPYHRGCEVSVGLLREIIAELGITRDEWIEL
jgi:predicted RNA binding protein YcfA (HicA-like mRNA interferase family)